MKNPKKRLVRVNNVVIVVVVVNKWRESEKMVTHVTKSK